MSRRAMNIALRSRLYGLIAERPELAREDRAERIDATLPPRRAVAMSTLDSVLVEGADELDRMCGYAVAKLRSGTSAPLLDVLGMLDGDRLLAMYYALTSDRRTYARRDEVWSYRVANEPEGIEDAIADVAELVTVTRPDPDSSIGVEVAEFHRELRRYRAGLDHELTDEQVALADDAPLIFGALLAGEDLDSALASMRTVADGG